MAVHIPLHGNITVDNVELACRDMDRRVLMDDYIRGLVMWPTHIFVHESLLDEYTDVLTIEGFVPIEFDARTGESSISPLPPRGTEEVGRDTKRRALVPLLCVPGDWMFSDNKVETIASILDNGDGTTEVMVALLPLGLARLVPHIHQLPLERFGGSDDGSRDDTGEYPPQHQQQLSPPDSPPSSPLSKTTPQPQPQPQPTSPQPQPASPQPQPTPLQPQLQPTNPAKPPLVPLPSVQSMFSEMRTWVKMDIPTDTSLGHMFLDYLVENVFGCRNNNTLSREDIVGSPTKSGTLRIHPRDDGYWNRIVEIHPPLSPGRMRFMMIVHESRLCRVSGRERKPMPEPLVVPIPTSIATRVLRIYQRCTVKHTRGVKTTLFGNYVVPPGTKDWDELPTVLARWGHDGGILSLGTAPGTGKGYFAMFFCQSFAIRMIRRVVHIAPRRSLVDNMVKRWREFGGGGVFDCYALMGGVSERPPLEMDGQRPVVIVTTRESIGRMPSVFATAEFLFIDEFGTVMSEMTSSTMDGRQESFLREIEPLLANATHILIGEGYFTEEDRSVLMAMHNMRSRGPDSRLACREEYLRLVQLHPPAPRRHYQIMDSVDRLVDWIISKATVQLEKLPGEREAVLVACQTKGDAGADGLFRRLVDANVDPNDICLLNNETNADRMLPLGGDFNSLVAEYAIVIHTSVLGQGVDITHPVTGVAMLINAVFPIGPRGMLQMSYRARNPRDMFIPVCIGKQIVVSGKTMVKPTFDPANDVVVPSRSELNTRFWRTRVAQPGTGGEDSAFYWAAMALRERDPQVLAQHTLAPPLELRKCIIQHNEETKSLEENIFGTLFTRAISDSGDTYSIEWLADHSSVVVGSGTDPIPSSSSSSSSSPPPLPLSLPPPPQQQQQQPSSPPVEPMEDEDIGEGIDSDGSELSSLSSLPSRSAAARRQPSAGYSFLSATSSASLSISSRSSASLSASSRSSASLSASSATSSPPRESFKLFSCLTTEWVDAVKEAMRSIGAGRGTENEHLLVSLSSDAFLLGLDALGNKPFGDRVTFERARNVVFLIGPSWNERAVDLHHDLLHGTADIDKDREVLMGAARAARFGLDGERINKEKHLHTLLREMTHALQLHYLQDITSGTYSYGEIALALNNNDYFRLHADHISALFAEPIRGLGNPRGIRWNENAVTSLLKRIDDTLRISTSRVATPQYRERKNSRVITFDTTRTRDTFAILARLKTLHPYLIEHDNFFSPPPA